MVRFQGSKEAWVVEIFISGILTSIEESWTALDREIAYDFYTDPVNQDLRLQLPIEKCLLFYKTRLEDADKEIASTFLRRRSTLKWTVLFWTVHFKPFEPSTLKTVSALPTVYFLISGSSTFKDLLYWPKTAHFRFEPFCVGDFWCVGCYKGSRTWWWSEWRWRIG